MPVTVLDSVWPEVVAEHVRAAVGATRAHALRHERFAPCSGCFECWIAHPGTCKASDAANDVMRDVVGSSEVVWVTRPRHGCWDSLAKQALDKCLGLISPFFGTEHGETHHHTRYGRFPRFGVVAVVDPDETPEDRERFRRLFARNAVNFHSDQPWVAFVSPGAGREEVAEAIAAAKGSPWLGFPNLAPFPPRSDAVGPAGKRALLLVGSAKASGTSLSERLGRALLERLAHRGWSTDLRWLHHVVKLGRPEAPALVEAIGGADLVVLAAPVYVDCLPAVVLAALERMGNATGGAVFLPIVQCGFPEPEHLTLALEVLSTATRRLGYGWAGHLAVPGGPALASAPLDRPGLAGRQVEGLDGAAAALDAGQPVPESAIEAFGTAVVSPAVYRFAGNAGWVAQAWGHGVLLDLGRRPFPESAT